MLIFEKNARISKIKKALAIKGIFSETRYVCGLTNQTHVSSIILPGFKRVDNSALPSHLKTNS